MAKTLLILFILLLCNEVKAASFNITYQTDTTAKPIVFIPQRDSLNLQDSLRLLKLDTQSIKKKRTLKIIGGSLAVVLYLKFALSIARSQIKLLALALFAIVIFVSLALKKKVKTNSDKKEEEQTVNLADSESTNSNLQKNNVIKSQGDSRWHYAWNYALFFGIIGMVIPVLGFIVSLSPLLILGPIGFILALFLFFAGFKGQYKSKKQRNRGIWKAILGLFLPFIPYLFLLIALMNGEEGR